MTSPHGVPPAARTYVRGHHGHRSPADVFEGTDQPLRNRWSDSRCLYRVSMPLGAFEVICEVEPATRPDIMHVRHQIGIMSRIATAYLIPDNHIGRATVSSIAVAHEVSLMGGRAIACLNARDRNVLGFRRDLLTAAAYGVEEFLFVYGDRPESGARSDDLTVRSMLAEARGFTVSVGQDRSLRVGVTSGLRALPAWKSEADFLFTQVTCSLKDLIEWRSSLRAGDAPSPAADHRWRGWPSPPTPVGDCARSRRGPASRTVRRPVGLRWCR